MHCVVPLYMEVGIELRFEGLNERLCLLARDNINYFGCDYGMCYFMCKTFYNVVGGKPRWLDMERPCVQLCTISSSHCGWSNGPILSHGSS